MGVRRALRARGRAVGLVRRRSPSVPVVARSLLPASSLLGADCVHVVVSRDRARGRARVPAAADIWSAVPNHDFDHRIPAGGGSIVATAGRGYSASVGIRRWVSGVPLRRARRSDAPRGRGRVGGGSDPSKAREERPCGFAVAFTRWLTLETGRCRPAFPNTSSPGPQRIDRAGAPLGRSWRRRYTASLR